MPINQQISDLVSNTSQLLDTVNVSRQSIDNAANTAETVLAAHESDIDPHEQYVRRAPGLEPVYAQLSEQGSAKTIQTNTGILVGLKPKYTAVIDCETEINQLAANKNKLIFTEALNDLETSGGQIFIRGGGYFTEGYTTSSRITIRGEGENGPVIYRPATNQPFFMAQRRKFDSEGVQITNPQGNTELQLEATGAIDLVIIGNRQQRCRGIELRGCDHAVIHNVHVRGIAGAGLNLQHVREYHIYGYVGRFNGWIDPNDPTIVEAAFIWGGDVYSPFENSNLSIFHGVQEAFSFGPCWDINGPSKNSIVGGLVHMIAPTNTSLENIIVKEFGGSLGWDSSGNPNNILSALLQGGPNIANISGRKMLRGLASCSPIQVRGKTQNFNIDHVNIVGHSGMHLVRVDDESEIIIGSGTFSASSASRFSVTAEQGTGIFTISSIQSGLLAQVPETGTPGQFTTFTTSPQPIVTGSTVYVIRINDTSFRLAESYENAISGNHIPLTSSGSGLEFTCGGQMLYATRDSEICVGKRAHFNDGWSIALADETSFITSVKQPGNRKSSSGQEEVFGAGPQLPSNESEQLLFQGRNLSFNASGIDYILRKQFRGSRFIPTRVQIIRRSGGATTVNGNVQIHTSANASGTTLLTGVGGSNNGLSLSGLSSQNQVIEVTPRPTISIPISGGSGASFIFNLTDNGVLINVSVTNGGTGYSNQNNLLVSGLNGCLVNTITSGGVITSVTIVNPGSGFVRNSTAVTALYARMDVPSGNSSFRFDIRVYGRVID